MSNRSTALVRLFYPDRLVGIRIFRKKMGNPCGVESRKRLSSAATLSVRLSLHVQRDREGFRCSQWAESDLGDVTRVLYTEFVSGLRSNVFEILF